MYDGKVTLKLEQLLKEYEEIFGYTPDGEIAVDYGGDYKAYVKDLERCIKEKKMITRLYKWR